MKRTVRIINSVINVVSGHFPAWMCIVMMLLVLTEVVSRYVFNSPLRVADEISAYMLAAIVFLGLGYTWKEKSHIQIEFALNLVPKKVRKWMELITLVIAVAFVPVIIYATYDLILTSLHTGIRGYGWMRIPLVWPRLTLVLGTFILLLPMLIDLIETVRTFRTPGGKAQ